MQGLFIAFEGGEGAGKSSQCRALAADLEAAGNEVVLTREPGGTDLGKALRALLLDPANGAPAPRAELLMYAADRAHHVSTVIFPALARGAVVITDRYIDSSMAYQGAGRSHDPAKVLELSLWAAHDLVPDITFLLDVDPEVGLARAGRSEFGTADRFEQEKIDFHQRVRNGFLARAKAAPDRYAVLDASAGEAEIKAQILPIARRVLELRRSGADG